MDEPFVLARSNQGLSGEHFYAPQISLCPEELF